MPKTIIRFKSSQIASEIAYILQGDWDGGTRIILKNFDKAALQVALGLTGNHKDDYTIENEKQNGDKNILFILDEYPVELFKEEFNQSQQTMLTDDEILELLKKLDPDII